MTGSFTNLRALQQRLIDDGRPNYVIATDAEKAAIQWLTEICIKEASAKKEGWNWKTWREKVFGQQYVKRYGELYAKLEFLGDCHEKLDHREFHLKVFSLDTQMLIDILYAAIIDKKDELSGAKGRILNRNPNLAKLLQSLGYHPDKDWGGLYRKQGIQFVDYLP